MDARWVNVAAFAVNTGVTFTIGAGRDNWIMRKLGLKDNKTISEKYPTLVTPSGWAFSIWGAIFGLQTGFSVWQLGADPSYQAVLATVTKPWVAACLVQSSWGIAFGADMIPLSSGLIGSLAYLLSDVYANISVLDTPQMFTKVPFAMHSTWVTAASLVNLNILGVSMNASRDVQLALAWGTNLVAFMIGVYRTLKFNDPVIAFTTSWALLAIATNKKREEKGKDFPVEKLSLVGKVLGYGSLALGIVLMFSKQK